MTPNELLSNYSIFIQLNTNQQVECIDWSVLHRQINTDRSVQITAEYT